MHITQEVDYGVRAVVALAAHDGRLVSKKGIAEEFLIPVNFLAIILPKLVQARIIESVAGPKGGYRLAKNPGNISILDIVGAVGEGCHFTRCQAIGGKCELMERCPTSRFWRLLKDEVETYLKGITFARLAEDYAAMGRGAPVI